ncbi:hypothetical protein H4R33_001365 [Dimargaris cristalligena]|uniref:Small ribosomal subunit protein mS41 n=1 Tax=Dimargaris cristalligena TaxID=215637 RepID=A0A4Q0A093_9FUNG|nr:hypothetical protein H4R33_001365 [Dimargaris cristalligena]RKP38520.1 IGR protein motif-domain-containing protein [Dimargaris cristalligena]|eukprot:RKP38520.1 IGR protein motif-domain-containing protein [Dimargaris cristalligena]
MAYLFTKATTGTTIFRSHVRPLNKILPKTVPEARNGMDSQKFLETIGRGCEKLSAKIPDWETLFTMSSSDMKHKHSIPTPQRKWVLSWTEKYRQDIDPYFIRPSRKGQKKK